MKPAILIAPLALCAFLVARARPPAPAVTPESPAHPAPAFPQHIAPAPTREPAQAPTFEAAKPAPRTRAAIERDLFVTRSAVIDILREQGRVRTVTLATGEELRGVTERRGRVRGRTHELYDVVPGEFPVLDQLEEELRTCKH